MAPLGLKVTASGTTSLTLGWASRGSGIRYRVSYSTTASFANPVYKRETSTKLTLSGLQDRKSVV